jgi:hypothetical protein
MRHKHARLAFGESGMIELECAADMGVGMRRRSGDVIPKVICCGAWQTRWRCLLFGECLAACCMTR